jgi:hypothetical protein
MTGKLSDISASSVEAVRKTVLGQETRLEPSNCCECGKVLDACGGPSRPEAGDYTMCMYCGSLNIFDEGLKLRGPTDDEIFTAAADPTFQFLRMVLERARARVDKMHKSEEKAGAQE